MRPASRSRARPSRRRGHVSGGVARLGRVTSPTSAPARGSAKRSRPAYRCSECGWTTAKWVGRCGECQEWGTIAEIDVEAARATPTGVAEFDRVLGGGIVPGAVVLLAGEPGVGKSTLLLAVASNVAAGASDLPTAARGASPGPPAAPRRVLYVTGEESAGQVRLRAERVGALAPGLLLAAETDLATVLGHIEATDPDLLVVDSVQTVASAEVDGSPGGVSQVREVAAALIGAAKARDLPVILVGHVTKDGSVAG